MARAVRAVAGGSFDPEAPNGARIEFESRTKEATISRQPVSVPKGVTNVDDGEGFPVPVADPAWRLEVEGFDPLREREVESWLTVGNGRTGTRGSLEEGTEASDPEVYVAGLFGRTEGDVGGPKLVPGPEWVRLDPRVGADAVRLDRGDTIEHRRVLDLRQGILFRTWRQRLPSGDEVAFRSARFASLADRQLLVLEAEATSTGSPVHLADGIPLPAGDAIARSRTRAKDGHVLVSVGARGGSAVSFAISTAGEGNRLRRYVAVGKGRGGLSAERALARAEAAGAAAIRSRHVAAWDERWRSADVVIDGDAEMQRALRFALYHLISAGDPESDDASIGARGLTGSGYRGHVFWDTDVFVLPFLIYTHPLTARALLAYRYRTLPAARDKAAALGYRGALFAWESADTGEETTPPYGWGPQGAKVPILTGVQEHHISADVAWAAWRYWQATGDDEFLEQMGAEILLETARFWASRARRGRDGRHHIARVIGPDEYHEGVRDNAFTNRLAAWNIRRGLDVAGFLAGADAASWRALSGRIGLRNTELARWRRVASNLADGSDPRSLVYEQFVGFHKLEPVIAAEIAPRPYSADAVLGRDRVRASQIVKQADVLMLPHMLPEELTPEEIAANYRHYEPRTSHGSSLSPAIHAAIAARVGDLPAALDYFRMAAAVDLDDRMGNSSQGIHMATLGGLWQAAVMGFGGFRPEAGVVRLDPSLPPGWERLRFPLLWRGTAIDVDVGRDCVEIRLDGLADVAVGGLPCYRLAAGRYRAHALAGGWSEPEQVMSS